MRRKIIEMFLEKILDCFDDGKGNIIFPAGCKMECGMFGDDEPCVELANAISAIADELNKQ